MRSLTEMTPDELQEARRAAETLIRFRTYLPPDAILVMVAGRFRDDVRDVLEMEPEPRAYRGQERNSLDELTSGPMVVTSGSGNGCGAPGPHGDTDVKFRTADDGPLMRSLVNGRP